MQGEASRVTRWRAFFLSFFRIGGPCVIHCLSRSSMDKARGDERACDKKRAGEEHHARLNSLLFPLFLRSGFSKEATGTTALSLVPIIHAVPDYTNIHGFSRRRERETPIRDIPWRSQGRNGM